MVIDSNQACTSSQANYVRAPLSTLRSLGNFRDLREDVEVIPQNVQREFAILTPNQRIESTQQISSTQQIDSTQQISSTQQIYSTQKISSTQRIDSTQQIASTPKRKGRPPDFNNKPK